MFPDAKCIAFQWRGAQNRPMTDKTLLITGASSGLGAALTTYFSTKGAMVYAVARSKDSLEALAAENPEKIIPVVLDVTDRESVEKTIQEIDRKTPLDVLINNAATYVRSPFSEMDLETADQILDTNIKGTMYPTHAVLPGMIQRKQGRILQINSVAGTRGIPDESVYCASKHAIMGFSESLMQELIPHNIQVSVINPGGINTPLWEKNGNFYPGDRSTLIEPEDICELADYILSAPSRMLFKKMIFFPTGEWH